MIIQLDDYEIVSNKKGNVMRRYFIIIVLLIMIFLINCEKKITIEFNTNGGTHVQSVVINDIKLFKLPDNPIKDGF